MKFCTTIALFSLTLLGLSLTTTVRPAQAGFLDTITDAIRNADNNVNRTQNTRENAENYRKLLEVACPGSPPKQDLLDFYSEWYGSLDNAEREVLKLLISNYAEDKKLTWNEFKKSSLYKAFSSEVKSKVSKIFFNFRTITVEIDKEKRKDRLLALDSCLSGGEKKCG
jgi:hypothetical protein